MKVSILVPVYGVERYIERCAVSLFKQTYADIEYIFVDDCSPDSSIARLRTVMEHYPQRAQQVTILRNERNRGVGYVRALAVNSAVGDGIIFVDSDDYVPHDAVAQLVACMQATGADIVDGAYCEHTARGLSAEVIAPHIEDHTRLMRLMLCQDVVPSHLWARLIRRSLYTANGINTIEGIDFAEDFSVMPRLMYHARRAVTDAVVYFYNVENQASYTHSTTRKHIISLLRSNAVVYDYFTRLHPDRRLHAAVQTGLLNMLRAVRRNGFPLTLVDEYCPYHTDGFIFRLLERMMRGRCPFCVANAVFLALRRAVSSL